MKHIWMSVMYVFVVLLPEAVFAQTILPECTKKGDCQIPDMVNTLINVAELIFGIVGSLTLFMFMYGGFVWVTSGGSDERITKGKTILKNAVLGLLVVFLAGAIIKFALAALGVHSDFILLDGLKGETVE